MKDRYSQPHQMRNGAVDNTQTLACISYNTMIRIHIMHTSRSTLEFKGGICHLMYKSYLLFEFLLDILHETHQILITEGEAISYKTCFFQTLYHQNYELR